MGSKCSHALASAPETIDSDLPRLSSHTAAEILDRLIGGRRSWHLAFPRSRYCERERYFVLALVCSGWWIWGLHAWLGGRAETTFEIAQPFKSGRDGKHSLSAGRVCCSFP